MKLLQTIAFAVCLLPQVLCAQTEHVESLFARANEYYESGAVDSAAYLYESIVQQDYESAALFFNLGNAYFKSGDIPAAILNFERAKRLAPTDADIDFNLKLATDRTVDKIEPLPRSFIADWRDGFLYMLAADGWAVLCLVLIVLASALFAVFYLSKQSVIKKSAFGSMVVCLLFAGVSWLSAWAVNRQTTAQNGAIVFTPSVTVMSAPGEEGQKAFVVHEGTKVMIQEERKGWLRIKLADGKDGWMEADHVERI